MYKDVNQEYNASLKKTEDGLQYYLAWLQQTCAEDISFAPLAKFADVDYRVCYKGAMHHYVECKVRYHNFGKYKLEKMPFRKFAVAHTLKTVYNLHTDYLLISNDNISVLDLTQKPDKVAEMIARYDRGDDKDIYALYNIDRFEVIKYLPQPKHYYR